MRSAQRRAIALAEEIKRRAAGPDHMAFDAVTWADLGRILEAMERTGRPDLLPVAFIDVGSAYRLVAPVDPRHVNRRS